MTIGWSNDLIIGVEHIDNQHKELFEKVSFLLEVCYQGKGKDEISKIIKYLEDYVAVHFEQEELLLKKYEYPQFDSHKAEHENFIKDFLEVKKKLLFEGPTATIIINLNHVLIHWLKNHVKKSDKAFGIFLKNKQSKCTQLL